MEDPFNLTYIKNTCNNNPYFNFIENIQMTSQKGKKIQVIFDGNPIAAPIVFYAGTLKSGKLTEFKRRAIFDMNYNASPKKVEEVEKGIFRSSDTLMNSSLMDLVSELGRCLGWKKTRKNFPYFQSTKKTSEGTEKTAEEPKKPKKPKKTLGTAGGIHIVAMLAPTEKSDQYLQLIIPKHVYSQTVTIKCVGDAMNGTFYVEVLGKDSQRLMITDPKENFHYGDTVGMIRDVNGYIIPDSDDDSIIEDFDTTVV